MCKQLYIEYRCHHEAAFSSDPFEVCKKEATCAEPEIEKLRMKHNYLCNECLFAGRISDNRRCVVPDPTNTPDYQDIERARASQLLFPDTAYLDGTHQYDPKDPFLFKERLSRFQADWLLDCLLMFEALNEFCWSDPILKNPTEQETMILIQLRNAYLQDFLYDQQKVPIPVYEGEHYEELPLYQKVINLLPTISTPVARPEICPVDSNCYTCCQKLADPTEGDASVEVSIKLPCKHLFGQNCIEELVKKWSGDEDSLLAICTICRLDFGLVEKAKIGDWRSRLSASAPWYMKVLEGQAYDDDY